MKLISRIWNIWLPIAQAIGNFQSQVILTIIYLIAALPFGLIFRFFLDPMRIKKTKILTQKSNFSSWQHPKQNLEEAKKQY